MKPKDPLEVFVRYPDGKERFTGHACGTCGILSSVTSFIGTEEELTKLTKDAATRCCNPTCRVCGKQTERYHKLCSECRHKQFNERARLEEEQRRAKAEKVSYVDYKGGGVFLDDRFFESVGDVLEHCECDAVDPPQDVWGAIEIPFCLDADHVVDNALDDHHDGAGDDLSNASVKELQELLDGWCQKQGIVSYEADWSTLVIMPEPESDDDEEAADPS